MSNFEERLLQELRTVVADRPAEGGQPSRSRTWRRPRMVLVAGLAAVLAVAAITGVFLFSSGTPAAYAVTKNDDGTVTVKIDSLTDAAGLESALQAAGVSAVVEYLPEGKMCKQPWFTPAGHAAGGTQQSSIGLNTDGSTTFTISGDRPAGDTLVVSTQTGPDGEQALGMGWAQGTVPACQVVDAPAGSGPFGSKPIANSAP